jgi:predicted glycogen debranching enzyme
VLRSIVDWHIRGTRFGIGMDPADGLLHAGEAGLQLTWMDAKIGDWVVTPRVGKPVELQALWYNVLRHVAAWWGARAKPGATEVAALAERTRTSFRARFVQPANPHPIRAPLA